MKTYWGRIIVKPIKVEHITKGGIHLPEGEKRDLKRAVMMGIIKEIGGNCFEEWKDKDFPEVGDKVLFNRYAGHDININGQDLKIMNDDQILLGKLADTDEVIQ